MKHQFHPDKNTGAGIFGLPYTIAESKLLIIPVPWDVTTSYRTGTSNAPAAIYNASFQLDLYREFYPEFYKFPIAMMPQPDKIGTLNNTIRPIAEQIIQHYEKGESIEKTFATELDKVNNACMQMNEYVYKTSKHCIKQGIIPVVLGGDHSTPFGLLQALAEVHDDFGVLQIDAHADLREAYQGFIYSHASIMRNVMKMKQIHQLVQVAIRDFCTEEQHFISSSNNRIHSYTDRKITDGIFQGISWGNIVKDIISHLPPKVYISFDIDGLDPSLCNNTGTPVPGGLSYNQALFLIESICKSGRQIIGFDLSEVTPSKNKDDDWDSNVAARLLYELCIYASYSNIMQT
jgi:agmatinase